MGCARRRDRTDQALPSETGCEHVHAAFGAGLPADTSERSTFGSFEDLAEMMRLFGREVIPAFAGA